MRRSHRSETLDFEHLLESVENFFCDFTSLVLIRFEVGSVVRWPCCHRNEEWNSAAYRRLVAMKLALPCSPEGGPWDGDGARWIGLNFIRA